jgi:hypothetical protein
VCGPAVDQVDKDNRELVDLNTSQALTADDIEAMKASGKVCVCGGVRGGRGVGGGCG